MKLKSAVLLRQSTNYYILFLVLSVVDIRVKSNIRKGKKNYKRFVGGL